MLAALPDTRIRWGDPRLRGGWLALLAAAIVALVFLPKSLTNNDEYYYAGQAYVLAHGRLTPQPTDPLLVPAEAPAHAFRFPVAWPAALALGRLISIRAMYAVALLVHLLGGAAVARMLVRRDAPAALAAAYVFHPVFWIYSRTLMSDIPTTAALLIAMDAWENRNRHSAAIGLAFASTVRLANIIAALGFGLSVISSIKRRFADAAAAVVWVALFVGVQMLVNHTLGGYWLFSRYASQGATLFDGRMLGENLALYVGGLALLPPFSLVFALARPRRVDRWAIVAAVVVGVYLPISYHNVSPNLLETLVGGQRYVLPAHAALMIATARTWTTVPLLRRSWLPIAAGVLVSVTACLAMARLEKKHLPAAQAVASCRPNVLAYNRYANRVAGSVDAGSYRLVLDTDQAMAAGADWDVLVLAPGFLSHQPGYEPTWSTTPRPVAGATCSQIGDYVIYDRGGRCAIHGAPCAAAPTGK